MLMCLTHAKHVIIICQLCDAHMFNMWCPCETRAWNDLSQVPKHCTHVGAHTCFKSYASHKMLMYSCDTHVTLTLMWYSCDTWNKMTPKRSLHHRMLKSSKMLSAFCECGQNCTWNFEPLWKYDLHPASLHHGVSCFSSVIFAATIWDRIPVFSVKRNVFNHDLFVSFSQKMHWTFSCSMQSIYLRILLGRDKNKWGKWSLLVCTW